MARLPDDDLGQFLQRVVLPPGWHVVHEPSVESTNDLAREASRRGWPDRSVFVTDYQTKGRGRQGRTWLCPPRTGLLFSVLLRPHDRAPQTCTMLAAVSLCEAVERLLALEPAIKWPNDVAIDGRKVAGVLAEATDDGRERAVIVGTGVNVNLAPDDLAGLPQATSLAIEAGRPVHRGELLALLLERFDSWLSPRRGDADVALWEAWNGRLWGREQPVRVEEAGQQITGTILGGDRDGTLVLRLADGTTRRVVAGELLP